MAADDVRDELLRVHLSGGRYTANDRTIAEREAEIDALLPTVDRIAREAAGKALRDAGEALHIERFNADSNPATRWPKGTKRRIDSWYAGIVHARITLRARAEAADGGGQA